MVIAFGHKGRHGRMCNSVHYKCGHTKEGVKNREKVVTSFTYVRPLIKDCMKIYDYKIYLLYYNKYPQAFVEHQTMSTRYFFSLIIPILFFLSLNFLDSCSIISTQFKNSDLSP